VREIVDGDEIPLVWHHRRRRKHQVAGVTNLAENHVLSGLPRYFSYHYSLIEIMPYKNLGPGGVGDHAVSANVYNTNAQVVEGVTDPFCRAICSCSQYADTQIARKERHVLPLNGKTFLRCAIGYIYHT
jgi:hypothetical protein